ncbi:MAG: SMP-30/gluconolactonase/LRE family protein [Catalinimonas sp.]
MRLFLCLLCTSVACAQTPAVEVRDPILETLIDPGAEVRQVAEGLSFTEGPLWSPRNTLLFSDIPANRVYELDPQGGEPEVFVEPSRNSNGLAYDADGRLLLCEHDGRVVSRRRADGTREVLADRWRGQRFNSPNDLVLHPTGAIFFTDPPWGLKKTDDDPAKELPFNGVFRLDPDGSVTLVDSTLHRPNGIAVSPDGRRLYVGESNRDREVFWMSYPLDEAGRAGRGERLYTADVSAEAGSADGLKVDERGNVWATGPGGVWVISPDGAPLGVVRFPELPANCAWGGPDGRTLYVTARRGVYTIETRVKGWLPPTR